MPLSLQWHASHAFGLGTFFTSQPGSQVWGILSLVTLFQARPVLMRLHPLAQHQLIQPLPPCCSLHVVYQEHSMDPGP